MEVVNKKSDAERDGEQRGIGIFPAVSNFRSIVSCFVILLASVIVFETSGGQRQPGSMHVFLVTERQLQLGPMHVTLATVGQLEPGTRNLILATDVQLQLRSKRVTLATEGQLQLGSMNLILGTEVQLQVRSKRVTLATEGQLQLGSMYATLVTIFLMCGLLDQRENMRSLVHTILKPEANLAKRSNSVLSKVPLSFLCSSTIPLTAMMSFYIFVPSEYVIDVLGVSNLVWHGLGISSSVVKQMRKPDGKWNVHPLAPFLFVLITVVVIGMILLSHWDPILFATYFLALNVFLCVLAYCTNVRICAERQNTKTDGGDGEDDTESQDPMTTATVNEDEDWPAEEANE